MNALNYLTGIAVILILGILASILARKARTSHILFLLITGIIIGNTSLQDLAIFNFPPTFLISIAILALAIVVFDGSSRFQYRELDKLTTQSLEVVVAFLMFNIVLITTALNIFYYGFTAQGVLFGIILSFILAGTDPATVFILLGERPHKVLQLLKVEALINTPIIVLFPFLFLDLLTKTGPIFQTFIDFIGPFLLQIIVGLGTGVLLGAVVFKAMRKWYSESLSPVAVISATLLSYILAENLGGNGVLAVAVLGLLFGNTYVKQKGTLQEFSSITAFSLQILVFVLIGMFMTLPREGSFWIASIVILIVMLISRYLALAVTTRHTHSHKERWFMTLNMPKGIAVAVVALTLVLLNIEGIDPVINLAIILVVYTLIMSTIVTHFSKYFIHFDIEQKK